MTPLLVPHRQTFPALFALFSQGLLPPNLHIVGYARTKMEPEEFHKREISYIKNQDDVRNPFFPPLFGPTSQST